MEITTERLTLKEFDPGDLEIYHRFSALPEIREFSTLEVPADLQESQKRLESIIQERSKSPRHTFSWKVILKEDGSFDTGRNENLQKNCFRKLKIILLHSGLWR